jgi:hypothetical protein
VSILSPEGLNIVWGLGHHVRVVAVKGLFGVLTNVSFSLKRHVATGTTASSKVILPPLVLDTTGSLAKRTVWGSVGMHLGPSQFRRQHHKVWKTEIFLGEIWRHIQFCVSKQILSIKRVLRKLHDR